MRSSNKIAFSLMIGAIFSAGLIFYFSAFVLKADNFNCPAEIKRPLCLKQYHQRWLDEWRQFAVLLPFKAPLFLPIAAVDYADYGYKDDYIFDDYRLQKFVAPYYRESELEQNIRRYQENKELTMAEMRNICAKKLVGNWSDLACARLKRAHPERHKISKTENIIHDIKDILLEATLSGAIEDYQRLAPYITYPLNFCLYYYQSPFDRSKLAHKIVCPWQARNIAELTYYYNFFNQKAQIIGYLHNADYNIFYKPDNMVDIYAYERYYQYYNQNYNQNSGSEIIDLLPAELELELGCEGKKNIHYDDEGSYCWHYKSDERVGYQRREQNLIKKDQAECLKPLVIIRNVTAHLIHRLEGHEDISIIAKEIIAGKP